MAASATRFQCFFTLPSGPIHTVERITPIFEEGSEVEAVFRRVIETNVMGTYYVTREAVRRMGKGGRIVFTASVWGKTAEGNFTAYVASKHANVGFMRSLARELAPRGIAVNAVCPGWVKTEASMRSLRDEARALGVEDGGGDDQRLFLDALQAFVHEADAVGLHDDDAGDEHQQGRGVEEDDAAGERGSGGSKRRAGPPGRARGQAIADAGQGAGEGRTVGRAFVRGRHASR